jgi:hypothetical protein
MREESEKFKEVGIGLGDPSSTPLTFVTKKITEHPIENFDMRHNFRLRLKNAER